MKIYFQKHHRFRGEIKIWGCIVKKIIFLVAAIVLLISSVANAEVLGRKVFAIDGKYIVYIPFAFEVPSGNCGNAKVREYIQSEYFPKYVPAHWEDRQPGEQIVSYSLGIFEFNVDGKMCSPEVVAEGPLFDMDVYGTWSGIEQDPEDLGVLVKGVGTAKNYFRLPTDDRQFSYIIVFPPYGRKYTLDDLVKFSGGGTGGIQPSGSNLVGAIVPDERGYLSKSIFFAGNMNYSAWLLNYTAKNIMLHDDQVVVLIYKENY